MPTTPDELDRKHRAANNPTGCVKKDIAAALDSRQLADPSTAGTLEPVCKRVEEKNNYRRLANVECPNPRLESEDRVLIHAYYNPGESLGLPPHWQLSGMMLADHPRRDFDDFASAGVDLIRGEATIHRTGRHERAYIYDVDVTHRSMESEGPDTSVVDQEQQQWVDEEESEEVGAVVVDRPQDEPPARWPAAEKQWLEQLKSDHGPLDVAQPSAQNHHQI